MRVTNLAENTHIVISLKILKGLGNCRVGLRSRTKKLVIDLWKYSTTPRENTEKAHDLYLKCFLSCPFSTQDYNVFSIRTSLPSSYSLYFFLNITYDLPCDHLSRPGSSCSFVSIIPISNIITTAVLQFMTFSYDLRGSLKSPSVPQLLIY